MIVLTPILKNHQIRIEDTRPNAKLFNERLEIIVRGGGPECINYVTIAASYERMGDVIGVTYDGKRSLVER